MSPRNPDDAQPRALVLGVGNLLWADEGFGVRCMEAFAQGYDGGDRVSCIEGGTQGLLLVPYFQAHQDVILFDAVDFGDPPGQMRLVETDDIPAFIGARAVSLHQTGMAEVLAVADLLGARPKRALLIGVQPVELEDYGGSLTPAVAAQVAPAVEIAAARLRDWGYALGQGSGQGAALFDPSLSWRAYEAGRPSAQDACRIGDERVLHQAQRRGD
jgi:hydrogenase maturation protease